MIPKHLNGLTFSKMPVGIRLREQSGGIVEKYGTFRTLCKTFLKEHFLLHVKISFSSPSILPLNIPFHQGVGKL